MKLGNGYGVNSIFGCIVSVTLFVAYAVIVHMYAVSFPASQAYFEEIVKRATEQNLRIQTIPYSTADEVFPEEKSEKQIRSKLENVTKPIAMTEIPKCDLCNDYDWLFILGTGRSGSTTILNMINSLPEVYLAGENGKAIKTLYTLPYFAGNDHVYELQHPEHVSIGPYKHKNVNVEGLYCTVQQFTRNIIGYGKKSSAIKLTGYKEIQVTDADVLNFWKSAFPCAKFIVNYRKNLKAQHASKFQQKVPLPKLRWETLSLLKWAKENNDRSFVMALEDFDVTLFNKLLQWIGVSGCNYTNVLHANKLGYKDDRNAEIDGECSYSRQYEAGKAKMNNGSSYS